MVCKQVYYDLLEDASVTVQSLEKIAKDYKNSPTEWYHLLCNMEDFASIILTPNLEIYTFCRCHLVADDGSTAHEHWHALVHFKETTLVAFKKRLQRAGVRHNSKTTFKKIICFDHLIGVMRYICCEDGQKVTRRGHDGLMGSPHTHYCRSVFDQNWLHSRGSACGKVREDIEINFSNLLGEEWIETNVGTYKNGLHNFETCLCARGKVGMDKKAEANKKRSAFYQTPEGQRVKKEYKEKAEIKKNILRQLSAIHVNKKAQLSIKAINDLIKML